MTTCSAFHTFLEQVFEKHVKQSCEVILRKEGNGPFWVQIEAIAVEEGQECRTVVMDIQAGAQTSGNQTATLEHARCIDRVI